MPSHLTCQGVHSSRQLAAVLVVALSSAILPLAHAQQHAPAALSGTLLDPTGGVVPKAEVRLEAVEGGKKYKSRSDDEGRYRFSKLPPGEYVVVVKYRGLWTPPLTIAVGPDGFTRDISLRIGGVTETVVVRLDDRPGALERSPPPSLRPAPTCEAATAGGRPVGGAILPPLKIAHRHPIYPPALRAARAVGTAVVQGTVAVDGRATNLRVVEATAPEFGTSAADAIAQWRFDPLYLNCRPFALDLTVTVNFVR